MLDCDFLVSGLEVRDGSGSGISHRFGSVYPDRAVIRRGLFKTPFTRNIAEFSKNSREYPVSL